MDTDRSVHAYLTDGKVGRNMTVQIEVPLKNNGYVFNLAPRMKNFWFGFEKKKDWSRSES